MSLHTLNVNSGVLTFSINFKNNKILKTKTYAILQHFRLNISHALNASTGSGSDQIGVSYAISTNDVIIFKFEDDGLLRSFPRLVTPMIADICLCFFVIVYIIETK